MRWLPDPLSVCRDCNLSGWHAGDAVRLHALAERYADQTHEQYLRRRTIAIYFAATAILRQRAFLAGTRSQKLTPQEICRIDRWVERQNFPGLLDQIWFHNHPDDYENTWSRAFELLEAVNALSRGDS